MKKHLLWAVSLALVAAGPAGAEVKTKAVTYTYDGVTLKGHLAWDDAVKGKRPGVLVVPEWWGLGAYEKKRAEQLAGLGYVALAADMYGDGKLTESPKEAGQLAGAVRKDLKTWMGRAKAGLKVLQDHDLVDARKLASIGYCFGGSTSLQLAHSGADIDVAVSFHGSLPVPTPEELKQIKAKILICHGADDKFIPDDTIAKVKTAYDGAKVAYKYVAYPGAVHSFTVPDADKRGLKGIAYNAEADQQSWAAMIAVFDEAFGKTGKK